MYTSEQATTMIQKNAENIAATNESVKSAHRRIDENDKVTSGIHELSKSIAGMTVEMKAIAERMDEGNKRITASIDEIRRGQKTQGERIGNIERTVAMLERNEKTLEKHEQRLNEIEKEPATKWKNLTWLIITGIATAIITFFLARFL